MDPNTLNLDLDPDPEFWPKLDPDTDTGLCYHFEINKNKNNLREKQLPVSLKQIFCLYFILTCVDLDPYSEYGSGSIKLLNADPIRIRTTTLGQTRQT